nr:MAG TPA: hypothetical protein [Ackermannviridae sp.]
MTIRLGNIFSYNQNVLRCFKLQGFVKPRLHSKLE